MKLYLQACEAGNRSGCIAVANGPDSIGKEQAFAQLVLLCAHGDARSCRVGGKQVVIRDAKSLCEQNVGIACASLGRQSGDPALMAKACDRGDPDACFQVAPSTTKETLTGYSLLWRGCDAGVALDCLALGKRLVDAKEVSKALAEKAVHLFTDDCLAGDSDACLLVQKPTERGLEVRRMRCGLDPSGCRELAQFYVGHSDTRAAGMAFERSCQSSSHATYEWHANDCLDGAQLLSTAAPERAAFLRKRACELDRKTCESN